MKRIKIFLFSLFFVPMAAGAASTDFMLAAQLLAAAKNADIQQVQALVNSGANVNFVDSTGLSIVCTALMNNDVRAAQILQMYGADASRCDNQIKQYNNRNKSKGGGGLFSGLSSAQSISLAAAGAAVVVGGLLLLTDVFDPGNDNNSGPSSGGTRPGGGGGGSSGGGGADVMFALPYGPAMPSAATESKNYTTNLNFYSPNDTSIYAKNFNLLTNVYGQNYLLMMRGYSPLARGYLGMQTLRNLTSREPLILDGTNLGDTPVLGGRPVDVALVTENGINSAGYKVGVDATSSLDDVLLPWTTTNDAGTKVNGASNSMVSSKYYNNAITLGGDNQSLNDDVTAEDSVLLEDFDLAGYGTVVNNAYASDSDDLIAKVVAGRQSGYGTDNPDYMGFMPNGQLMVFRTGNGTGFVDATDEITGTYQDTNGVVSKIDLYGQMMNVTMGDGNSFTASYTETTTDDEGQSVETEVSYSGYFGTDGLMYIDSDNNGSVDQAYEMNLNRLTLAKQQGTIDYLNYKALAKAVQYWGVGNVAVGRAQPTIVANASVIEPLYGTDVATIDDVLANPSDALRESAYYNFINDYYDVNTDDTYVPSADAGTVFSRLGTSWSPLVIFSTGAFETDSQWSGKTLGATFENAVPLLYENAEHLFMSVVPVGLTDDGTAGTKTVSSYSPSGKIAVAQWIDKNGTSDITTDDKYYKGRVCGIAGTGAGGVDPWCFAAAGNTDELAVASAAGAAGALRSAFGYLTNKDIFTLLALTADGPFLGTTSDGSAFNENTLTAYLKNKYELPDEYQFRVDNGADYLDIFAEVFGYGLINLERATTPGTAIYYYDADQNNIVSADGNAYWRAASNTMLRSSSVLNARGATIGAAFYDVLESVDGEMSMPRVWEYEFALGNNDKRALYMGDVLGDLKTRRDATQRVQIGNFGFSMAMSERAYVDNMNGLDNLMLDYSHDNWNFAASYQHYFTDGQSRFAGLSNPVLGLASDVVTSDVAYDMGNWTFGARAFSGAVTEEGLLEQDPTIAAQYMPARLGMMQGGETNIAWADDKLSIMASVGLANESDTLLGASSGGLLNLGDGNTMYVNAQAEYNLARDVSVMARATFAKTTSDADGQYILGLSDIYSDSFAVGGNIGNFDFSISLPLAIRSGDLKYSHAEYDVVNTQDGHYDLNIVDAYMADVSLRADKRETRFMASYKHNFGEFTDGAVGFIYRANPNHTDEFGNESIFMLKMTHRVGI